MGALRTVTVWLLILAAGGVMPMASICVEASSECGDVCTRCWCKQARAGDHVRARCGCCEAPPGTQAVTLIPPAIMPPAAPALGLAPQTRTPSGAAANAGPFASSVPDPPPRTALLF